jgi:hypothetical protein
LMAHEHRHVRDLARASRLEQAVRQTPDPTRRGRLEAKLDMLLARPRAETRAFEAQAFALGRLGRPIGMWWRAPQEPEMDAAYPPAKLNKALIGGYFEGLSQTLGASIRQASPERRQVVSSYLRGYRHTLEQQATTYFQAARRDGKADPQAGERYTTAANKVLEEAQRALGGAAPLTAGQAFIVGQADAIVGNGAVRAQTLLAN